MLSNAANEANQRPLIWMASTKADLLAMPEGIHKDVGVALDFAQRGEKSDDAKVLSHFGDAQVLEIVAKQDGNAYRAVYTVRFERAVYVLHVFTKKSKAGIATPKQDMDLIAQRLATADRHYQAHFSPTPGGQ